MSQQKQARCKELGGTHRLLAKGRAGESLAKEKLLEFMIEQALLNEVGDDHGFGMCDSFLAHVLHNVERTSRTSTAVKNSRSSTPLGQRKRLIRSTWVVLLENSKEAESDVPGHRVKAH